MLASAKWQINCPTSPAVFRRYIERNVARGLDQIKVEEPKLQPLYIVCSGPSLIDTWQELIDCGGEIWALNAAFDWLSNRGIRSSYGVCLGAEDEILNYFQNADEYGRFLFAAQTHPKLIDRVLERGGAVTLWHPAHPPEWELPAGSPLVYGGGTIGTRVFDLAYILGFRDVHVLGLDACLSPDGRIAVDRQMPDDRRDDLKTFSVNGRYFVAMPSHAHQVEDFAAILKPLTGMEVTLYGDGLLQWSQTPIANQGDVA